MFRVHNLDPTQSKLYDLIPRLFRWDKSMQICRKQYFNIAMAVILKDGRRFDFSDGLQVLPRQQSQNSRFAKFDACFQK